MKTIVTEIKKSVSIIADQGPGRGKSNSKDIFKEVIQNAVQRNKEGIK